MRHAYRPFILASLTFASSLASLTGLSSLAHADAGPKSAAHAPSKTAGVAAPIAKRKRERTNVQSDKSTSAKKDAHAKKSAAAAPDADAKISLKANGKKVNAEVAASALAPLPPPSSPDPVGGKIVAHPGKFDAHIAKNHEHRPSRADHAVEPESTPKIEATLDPTIHFVPMSATTLAPMDEPIDAPAVKSGKVTAKDAAPITTVSGAGKKDGVGSKIAKKKIEKTCLHSAIDILRGVEEEKLALTKCDGTVAPGAVERLSILVRPSSASRPIASLTELSKVKGPELSPGVKKIDPLLVEHLETVVDHFSSGHAGNEKAKVFVISGYRPGAAGSFHQSGKALDFRIDGVKNEELVAFCKTLPDTGCGYYPNSSFVHMDIRNSGAGHVSWIDSSGPGEEPRYVSAWPPPAEPAHHDKSEAKSALNQMDKEMPPEETDEHPTDPEAISDMNQAPPADITSER